MIFTFECPKCKKTFELDSAKIATDPKLVKCCLCGDMPAPDIQTAYQNVGRTMADLQGCCECAGTNEWLPKDIRK